jgi:hypothetical protein
MKGWTFAPARFAAGVLVVCALGFPASALADAGGDANSGDVWLDTVGQPAGPGHEMDPHLPCADINLWGDKLADAGGSYTIDGWPPSGNKAQAYSSTWKYDGTQGGSQVIDVISVQTLIANAAANGDAPAHNGYHFKLQFSQDPQKHKTFWVDCPPPSSTPANQPQSGSQPAAQTAPAAGQQVVLGKRVSGHSRRARRRHRAHRKHHRVKRQAVLPAFTG